MSHRNQTKDAFSQSSPHVLLAVISNTSPSDQNAEFTPIQDAFQQTSELPCSFWSDKIGNDRDRFILLGSNYPNCIVEGGEFVAVSAGLPYGYRGVFGLNDGEDSSKPKDATNCSLAACIITFLKNSGTHIQELQQMLGSYMEQISGHFSVYLVHKTTGSIMCFNDPFGLMPVFYSETRNSVAISSFWDCLLKIPNASCPELDLDVVAEYMILGSTMGGVDGTHTFVKNVMNATPGTCLSIPPTSTPSMIFQKHRYIRCFGACDRIVKEMKESKEKMDACPPPANFEQVNPPCLQERRPWLNISKKSIKKKSAPVYAANVKVERMEKQQRRLFEQKTQNKTDEDITDSTANDNKEIIEDTVCLAHYHIYSAVRQAFNDIKIVGAALTGGGDTRLVLSCLPLTEVDNVVFQTHDKQKTDLRIAQWLASHLNLEHRRFHPMKDRTTHTMMLHEKIPIRKKQGNADDKYKEDTSTTYLQGRFGTELLGFLCFDKSSIKFRCLKDVHESGPDIDTLLRCIFADVEASSVSKQDENTVADTIVAIGPRSPLNAICSAFINLDQDQEQLNVLLSTHSSSENETLLRFDVPYALQIQLFTRAFLCDIYGGLQSGSWFAMPYSFFTRNSFSPFLDARLLRFLCMISTCKKTSPYEMYGNLYKTCLPDLLLKVPCNNKLLCMHAGIPRALKTPEKALKPFEPKRFVWKKKRTTSITNWLCERSNRNCVTKFKGLADIQGIFCPKFWNGAVGIMSSLSSNVQPEDICVLQRKPEVLALVEMVGLDEACVLSCRLSSFLLWYENRFLDLIHSFSNEAILKPA